MKKLLVFIILIAVFIIPFCAAWAEAPVEVSREPVDVRYTEAYEGIETGYQHKYDWWKGDFVLVPVVKTVHHNAKWEIKYRVTYDNGEEKTEWCKCTEAEYNNAKAELGGAEDG